MKKGLREYEKMVNRIGCQIIGMEWNKHIRVRLMLPDGHVFVNIIPSSPSDTYWVDANRQLIQRVIRENHKQA